MPLSKKWVDTNAKPIQFNRRSCAHLCYASTINDPSKLYRHDENNNTKRDDSGYSPIVPNGLAQWQLVF